MVAANGREWLKNIGLWRQELTLFKEIEFLDSFEMAQEKYEFLDIDELFEVGK